MVSKALGSFASMREMVQTEKDLVKAGVPIQTTDHGKIIPSTGTAKILITQSKILSGALDQSKTVGSGYMEKTAKTEILTTKVQNLFDEITGLKQELRDRPVITEQKFGFDWGLPSLDDIKTPLIIAGGALAGLFLLGKYIGRK